MKKLKFTIWYVLTLVFYGMCITISFSQNATSINRKRAGGLYLLQGFRNQNFSQINSQLNFSDFASSKEITHVFGAGGYGWFGRFKVGGEGNYIQNSNADNNKNTDLKGFGGNIYTSYLLNPNSKIHILPLIGLGGESVILSSNRNNLVATNFSQALEQPQTLQLKTGSFYLKTVLQFEYKAQRSVMGFQVGYQYAPSQKWQIANRSFENAPSSTLSNLFLQFSFGLE
ncbi:hypothetical protein V9L05_00580 [Bernardetia sp. Wsw4-3y2]|uniref:hypothetical protein n=1 Tax=Bernardetia sp. Wsw4-3y2 TaxID=3127471 RepID=UPI0030CB4BEF